jgi:imidazolonepropionase
MLNLGLGILTNTILIRGARQLLTLRGSSGPRRGLELDELQIISDGSLLIEGGILKEVGPTRRIENLTAARGATEISAVGKVVMPGFVDSHTRLAFPPHGAEAGGERALRLVRGSTARLLRAQNRQCLAAMARLGSTTVEVKTGCGSDAKAEIKLLRVLGSLDGDPLDVFPTFLFQIPQQDREAAVDWAVDEMLPKIRRRRLARFAGALWDHDAASPEQGAHYLRAARELGFALKVLAADGCCSEAISLALAHDATSVDNLDRVTEAGARLMARSRTMAVLTPGTLLEGSGCRAARLLADAGAAVTLATGFNPNQPGTLNMQTVVALAHLRLGLSVDEAIAAATINGAHALGAADRLGSLEPGKFADLLVLDAGDYRELGRHLGGNAVHLAMKRGKLIYRQSEVAASLPGTNGGRTRLW